MIRTLIWIAALGVMIALSCVLSTTAIADPADKSVGVGLGVGIATGPNVQLATSHATQLDVGFGYQLDDRMRFQVDHAWRLANLSGTLDVSLPVYLGIGGFMGNLRWGTSDAGIRMPLGLQADFARAPIQLFGELAPELVLVEVVDRTMEPPRDSLALTGLMGVRAAF